MGVFYPFRDLGIRSDLCNASHRIASWRLRLLLKYRFEELGDGPRDKGAGHLYLYYDSMTWIPRGIPAIAGYRFFSI
jgi:hypothetical protein